MERKSRRIYGCGQLGRVVVSVAVAALITFASAQANAEAIVHFAFDETGGTTAADSAGNLIGDLVKKGHNANPGDPVGAFPTFVPGRFGNALFVDGVGGNNDTPGMNVRTGDFSGLDFGTTANFSIAYWLKSDPAYAIISADSIFSGLYGANGTFSGSAFQFSAARAGGFNGHYLRYGAPASPDIQPAAGIDGPALVEDDEWHHHVFTVDRDGDSKIYVDGAEAGSATYNSTAIDYTGATGINLMGDQYGGSIDELWVFNSALSAVGVDSLYRTNKVPEPATVVLLTVGLAALLGVRRRRR